jgi:hypothetical protein
VESIIAFTIITGIAISLIKESCFGSETGTHNPAEEEVPVPKPVAKILAKKPVAKKASVKKPVAKKAPVKKPVAKKAAVKK